ncbi:DUF2497 domain-containing protein [Sphingomonas sp.]|jgi:hypothetical protein|uniref:DUF2497 domain-containing protein n=1 Tax=Sphingomonas sp. TaxID=28214 RepID=UPI002ED77A7F
MGDISAEPSMEEILSSIKRIIAEEGEGIPQRTRRPQRASVTPIGQDAQVDSGEVLELSEPLPAARRPADRPTAERASAAAPQPAPPAVETTAPEPIVSQQAAAASRGSLEALSRVIVRPDGATADNTLEALVREMLRPMLRDWLDARLPTMVEAMVAREIERITGSSS